MFVECNIIFKVLFFTISDRIYVKGESVIDFMNSEINQKLNYN